MNQVNSNVIFFFPIISSYLYGDKIYCLLSVMIITASTCYHFFATKNYFSIKKYLLLIDRCIATTCYLYMFYFVNKFGHNQFLLYTLLVFSILVYLLGERRFAEKYNVHSYFHIIIGIVAGIIPLFR